MQAWLFHPLSDSPKFTFPKALYVDKTQIVFIAVTTFTVTQYLNTWQYTILEHQYHFFFCLPTIYTNLDSIDLKQAAFTKLKLNTSKLFAQINFHFQNSETLLTESRPIVIFFFRNDRLECSSVLNRLILRIDLMIWCVSSTRSTQSFIWDLSSFFAWREGGGGGVSGFWMCHDKIYQITP